MLGCLLWRHLQPNNHSGRPRPAFQKRSRTHRSTRVRAIVTFRPVLAAFEIVEIELEWRFSKCMAARATKTLHDPHMGYGAMYGCSIMIIVRVEI